MAQLGPDDIEIKLWVSYLPSRDQAVVLLWQGDDQWKAWRCFVHLDFEEVQLRNSGWRLMVWKDRREQKSRLPSSWTISIIWAAASVAASLLSPEPRLSGPVSRQWQAADISSPHILQILQLWSCDSLSKTAFALLVVSHGSHSHFTPPSFPFRVYFCIILSKWKLTLFVALSFTHGTHKVNFNGSGANSICLLLYFPFFEFCTIFWRNISSNYLRLCTNLLIIWLFHQINKDGEMEIIQLLAVASTKID